MSLRPYQVRINDKTNEFMKSDVQRGQIYAPTGAGKTVCFIELIKNSIASGMINIAVLHPRLALSKDQLSRFKKDIGTDVHYTSFHSGGHERGSETVGEKSTLVVSELVKIIDGATNILKKPHITFTTYNSYRKLVDDSVKFDLIICDEAHYLVQDQFNYLDRMDATKILFYTATPIREDMEDEETGMMDFTLFGNVIESVTPSELILGGYIVAPLPHFLECATDKQSDTVDIIDIVAISYVHQYTEAASWGMGYHQMMVATRNVAQDILIDLNGRIKELRDKIAKLSDGKIDTDNFDIYGVEAGGVYINGSLFAGDRAQVIEQIKNSGTNAIVAHYDTLSEGIDISTLNGAVLMRSMTKAKMIQTIGRPARPHLNDLDADFNPRTDLFNIQSGFDVRTKRRSLITFPIIDGVWLGGHNAASISEAFITAGYDELTDYMPKGEHKPTGAGPGVDDDIVVTQAMASVIDSKMKRDLEKLESLFDWGDI